MIVIDMDMPECCGTCRIDVCIEWKNLKGYEMGQKRADTCPIKCDIEDIRAEIKSIQKEDMECDGCSDMGMVLDIIDRYTKGE